LTGHSRFATTATQLTPLRYSRRHDVFSSAEKSVPLQAIAGLLGVPLEDRRRLFDWTNQMIGDEDPEFSPYDSLGSAAELMWYSMQLAAQKAGRGDDDIVSALIDADADGQLTEAEFGMFVVTLAVAGNETTRQSITQGMMAFTEYPEQWEQFKAQRPTTAADEIIRWAFPINAFQRTALTDTELGGVELEKGQRLVLFYRSANFDEEVFDDPFRFNALRDPNPHLGFGGTGVHYCVGVNLTRMTHRPHVQRYRRPPPQPDARRRTRRLRSSMINGIKHWQVDYSGGRSTDC